MIRTYLVRSGRYKGMWHVRDYIKGKYHHIGRFRDYKQVAEILKGDTNMIMPTGKNILFKEKTEATQSESGIYLQQDKTDATRRGEVLGVGPQVQVVKAGDIIIYDLRDSDMVKLDVHEYIFIKEEFVMGVIRG